MPRIALSALGLCALLTAGCLRAQAKTVPEMPPLDVPPAPPRIVETSDQESSPPVGLIGEPARSTPPRAAAPTPALPRTEPKAEPKTEPVAGDAAKPPEEPARPTTTLQTTPTQQEGEVEARIRVSLTRATGDLNRINSSTLDRDAKTQYDTARRFVSQAEDALRAKNLVFAGNLADKAAALAAQLASR